MRLKLYYFSLSTIILVTIVLLTSHLYAYIDQINHLAALTMIIIIAIPTVYLIHVICRRQYERRASVERDDSHADPIQPHEKEWLSRELHDNIGQALYSTLIG